MALSFAGMCVWDKIQKSSTSFCTWIIAVMLLWGAEARGANFYYDFLWSAEDNQYLIDSVLSPDLILYENNNYIFKKTAGFDSNLTLTDTNDSSKIPLNIDEIFNNGLTNRKDYIHFAPNLNTPRELFYTNFDSGESSQNTGKIFIKEKTSLEFIMPVSLADEEMLGSDIHFDSNLNLFVSAPGKEGENGKVYFFEKNSSIYTSINFVETPSSGRTQFGGSLLSTDANLFIGAPDENSFRGAVYIYALNESGFASSNYSQLLMDSSGGSGDLFGWDMAVSGEDLAISSPYAGSNNRGQVVLFAKEGENMNQNGTIFSSGSQSGDEFGYDIEFDEHLLFVGAPGHDLVDGLDSGAVYIYQKSDGNWNETKITAPDFSPGDRFGHSLAFKNNLLFVGAEFGDGQEVDCGSVYVFERVDSGWEFRKELFPSRSGSNQLFSSQLKVDQNLLCVTAPGLDSDGNSSIYLFRMDEATDDWELISLIDLDFFDDHERTKSSLAFKNGTIAVGNPNHNQQTGLVSGFFNPSWQVDEKPSLHPIFSKSTPTILTVLEDEDSVHYPFQFEYPFDVEVSWSIDESNSSIGSFELNSTTGEFFYYPETDFNGIHSFKIKASLGDSSSLHFFQVHVNAVNDDPYFTDEENILPVAEDGSEYNGFTFPVFDADGDSLLVSLVSGNLPPQMEISDNMLIGTPNVGNISASDYSFTVSLSDGNGGAVANHTYNLVVLPRNEAPVVSFRGDINSSFSINLFEDFSPNDWSEILDDFNISDPEENNYSVSLLEEPNFGKVVITESQGYFYYSPLNFHGIDKFKIRVLDDHPSNPKFTDLSIKVSIKEVNDVPVLLSSLPSGTAGENEFYEHKFEFWDPDIGDSVNLSFEGLPSWLVFDGNRTISGIPDRTDYIPDHFHSVKFKASDQRGGHFSEYFNLVVEPVNYPPVIVGADNQSFEITEDTTEHWRIELNATDFDTVSEELLWEVKVAPSNGVLNLAGSGANAVISFLPDANFTGVDEFVVSVYNEQDPLAEDTVRFTANVSNVSDPPVFLSQPYTVVLRGTPWDYNIKVFDPDPLEDLLIEIIGDLPEWIDYNDTQKLLSGVPPQTAEESFPIAIKVMDKNGLESVQFFSLNLVNSIELITIREPQIGNQVISEDSNWSGGGLTVENVQGRKISWTVIEEPLHGIIQFEEIQNGSIDNLTYFPNNNFYGEDFFVIQASDGYSSEFRNFNFAVTEVADPPIFLSGNSESKTIEDRDDLNITVDFTDGDGLETLNYEILELPTWVDADFSGFKSGKITLGGVPDLGNLGVHKLRFRIYGIEDLLEAEFSLDILVKELNKPVTLLKQNLDGTVEVDTLTFVMMEDTPSSWVPPKLFAEDPETNSESLLWEIIEASLHGHASIDENGSNFFYSSDANFSGTDQFVLGITDDGVNTDDGVSEINSSARTTLIPVKVLVQSSNDKPVILSEPITQWTDEYPFEYRLHVYDSDWPWQGYPQLQLISKLPSWATWRDDGNGSGILSGQPAFWDEGKHFFSFEIKSGEDQLKHQFTLDIIVEDYPPLITSESDGSRVDKVQIVFEEDSFNVDEWRSITSLVASDPENNQSVLWSVHQLPTSGVDLNLYSDKNKIQEIHYTPPTHFYGTDKFVLKASEGKDDRFSLLPIDVVIKPIPDPPVFLLEDLPPQIITAYPGDHFEVLFTAVDYDKEPLSFKTFFSGSHYPSWFQKLEENSDEGTILLGGEPPLTVLSDANFSFTLVVSDPSGRFSTTQHTVVYEEVNFPPVILEGEKIDIIFDETLSTENFPAFPIVSVDANLDSLSWNVSVYHQPRYGEVLLVQEDGILQGIRYIPSDSLPVRDTFTLEVFDGEDSDTIFVNASFDHSRFLVKLPSQFPPLYEGEFFNLNFFVQDNDPQGSGYTAKLMQGPSWLTINKVNPTNFEIMGEVPQIGTGTHLLSLKVTHPNGYDSQFVTTEIVVKERDKSNLSLLGAKELFLNVDTDLNHFLDPGYEATNSLGEDVSSDQVVVTLPPTLELGKNIVTYQYGEHKAERILWGIVNSPYDGISSQTVLENGSLIANGGPPFADFILEPDAGESLSNLGSYFDGFKIHKLSRDDFGGNKIVVCQSTIKCFQVYDFQYSNSFLYVLGIGLQNDKKSIFLNKIDLSGRSSWVSYFQLSGDVSKLKITSSSSGDLLISGSLLGSLKMGSVELSSSSRTGFVFLIDYMGKLKGSSILGQVEGKVSATNNPLTDNWYLAFEQMDENSIINTKLVCLDRSLTIIHENIFSDLFSSEICSFKDAVFLSGLKDGINSSDRNLILYKLDLDGSTSWEKEIVRNASAELLQLIDINDHLFGNINLSLVFSGNCYVMGTPYHSSGGSDSLLLSLSNNEGELLWIEQIGGLGDDVILSQISNESGTYGITISSNENFSIRDDVVLSAANMVTHYIQLQSISQPPKLLQDPVLEFVIDETNLSPISVINQFYSKGIIHGFDNWLEIINEDNEIFISCSPTLENWIGSKDTEQTFTLRILGENNSYSDLLIPYKFILPQKLQTSQAIIPPADKIKNIFGNAEVIKIAGFNDYSYVVGNFKGNLSFDGVDHYSSARSAGFVYRIDNSDFSLIQEFIISSDISCSIVDICSDEAGDIYILGNHSGKTRLSNRSLPTSSGSDIFIMKIGSNGVIQEFESLSAKNDQKAHSFVNGDGELYICGSFSGAFALDDKETKSFGKTDGFIGKIKTDDFSSMEWILPIGGTGNDYCHDIDWTGSELVLVGDFSDQIDLDGTQIQLVDKGGSFCAKISTDGDLMSYYTFESIESLSVDSVSYDITDGGFLIAGEFFYEISSKDSFLSSSFQELFIAKVDSSLKSSKLVQLNGYGEKKLADVQMTDLGYLYVAGTFSSSLELAGKTFTNMGRSDAFVAKLNSSTLSVLDYYTLQSPEIDRIFSVFNYADNELLVSGESFASELLADPNYLASDPFLISLDYKNSDQIEGQIIDTHPIGVNQPFKFDFITFGWGISQNVFKTERISLPSWANLMTDALGNGYISGFSPNEAGKYSIAFSIKSEDGSEVLLSFDLVIIDGQSTPSLVIPKRVDAKQFTDFEIPFYIENIDNENIQISSNFPSWIEIFPRNRNEFLLSGRPEGQVFGENVYRLSASTLAGLTDHAEITINVERSNQSSVVNNEEEFNTWMTSWIGSAYILENGWAYHSHLKWIYLQSDQFNGAWIWTKKWDWLWSNDQYWDGSEGNFFSKNLNQWVFIRVDEENNRNLIYNYQVGKWYPF